jgi:hypothetical protein
MPEPNEKNKPAAGVEEPKVETPATAEAEDSQAEGQEPAAPAGAEPSATAEPDRAAIRLTILNDPNLPADDFEKARGDSKYMDTLVDAWIEADTEAKAGTAVGADGKPKPDGTELPKPEGGQGRLSGWKRRQMKIDRQAAQIHNLEQEVATLKQGRGPEPKPEPAKPTKPVEELKPEPDVYAKAGKTYEQYVEDLTEWKAKKIASDLLAKDREERKNETAARRQQFEDQQRQEFEADRNQRWAEQVIAAREKYEDFDEAVFANKFPRSEVMVHAILDSDVGAELSYYFGNNPEAAQEIAEMPPISALRAIGRIEARFEKPKAASRPNGNGAPAPVLKKKAVEPPPDPVNPVKTGGSRNVKDYSYYSNPDLSSAQEFEEARRTGKLR